MESITRSGRKVIKNLNKRFSTHASEFHFSVTPTKSRKCKLNFDDICDEDNSVHHDSVDSSQKASLTQISTNEPSSMIVGFSYLPTQIRRKILSKPLSFTLMVAGLSGLGKSTFVNSLFLTDIYSDKYPGPSERCSKTVSVESTSILMTENSISLNMTIVDTPGFGRNIDNRACWLPLITYLKSQHCEYLRGEVNFEHEIHDTRVHCCLYFIAPNGHCLEKLDLECMKQLCKHVNLIPVIAKADTMTIEEIKSFKQKIRQDLEDNDINIFSFQDSDSDELDFDSIELPFAIAGSNHVQESPNGQRNRVRQYSWGTFEIDNPKHCDTSLLRNLLIRHCMYDLISSTHSIHYESYRRNCLEKGILTKRTLQNETIMPEDGIQDSTLERALNSTDD